MPVFKTRRRTYSLRLTVAALANVREYTGLYLAENELDKRRPPACGAAIRFLPRRRSTTAGRGRGLPCGTGRRAPRGRDALGAALVEFFPEPEPAGPRTLRELHHAAKGRIEHDWNQTADLLALLANCHRDPERRRGLFVDALAAAVGATDENGVGGAPWKWR